ncbi:formylglycine-generating enzyme family protein [bacterium]|nr:formylglycine-generating enzyme family protein [bacterium]
MKNAIWLIIAMTFFMTGGLSADTIVTQEVANVCGYVKGSTTLKLSGTLSDEAMEALSKGANVSIRNSFTNYLCSPTLLIKNARGYGKNTDTQNISVNSKNGKFMWTERDGSKNFSFAVGDETIKPAKAILKSSGTMQTEDLAEFETKNVTLFDMLCDSNINVCSYIFTPVKKGENFKYFAKEQDLELKFTANATGKANISFKLSPNAVCPAFTKYTDPFADTNKLYMVIDLSGKNYNISYLNDVPESGWTDEYKTTKLVLRRIEPGTFTMGSPEDELGRGNDETQHQVTLTQAYYIGIFEVTQKQYKLITGKNPSKYYDNTLADALPVSYVSYGMIRGISKGTNWPNSYDVDSTSFLGKLRASTGLVFDLPTEAQWEYACRAGTITALNSGKNLKKTDNCPNLKEVGCFWFNNYLSGCFDVGCAVVGSYLPNAWGLYDMHGNVCEWCLDWYGEYNEKATDPKGAMVGSCRLFRGGSARFYASGCRSANRIYDYPDIAGSGSGFRVVLVQ